MYVALDGNHALVIPYRKRNILYGYFVFVFIVIFDRVLSFVVKVQFLLSPVGAARFYTVSYCYSCSV